MAARIQEHATDPNKFDLQTHFWDSQGNLVKKNLYTQYVIKGEQYFERPVGSGNLWSGGNQPAGRIERTFDSTGRQTAQDFQFEAAHKAYSAPLSGEEKLHYQLEQEREARIAAEKELAAIRSERSPDKAAKSESTVLAKAMAGSATVIDCR